MAMRVCMAAPLLSLNPHPTPPGNLISDSSHNQLPLLVLGVSSTTSAVKVTPISLAQSKIGTAINITKTLAKFLKNAK